ncbi:MAG: hypothetical protein RL329_4120 [Bacteroidota bacterium]|jgi:hypothetical protein
MTYLEIAQKVLQQHGSPLSSRAVWNQAESLGLTEQKMGSGKTPWDTLSSLLFTDTRDNSNSFFIKIEDKPTRFGLKNWVVPAVVEPEIIENEDGTDDNYQTDAQLFDPIKQDIDLIQDKWSVYDHLRKLEKGRLFIQNIDLQHFQRHSVWKAAQKSRFIESLLMGFPIPPFYLNLREDGSYLIIDGLQRTITLKEYLNNEFTLSELTSLKRYNGKYFKDLPTALQAKMEDRGLNVYILKATTPMRVVYELFDRVNTGGTPLTRQEVRNGIFVGKSTQFLEKLAKESIFEQALDGSVSDKRMKDRESVLRYLAFKVNGYEQYGSDMSPFLEQTMEAMNQMTDATLEKLEQDFKRVMSWAVRLFEKQSFRLPIYNAEKQQKGRGSFNISVMESVCYALSGCTDAFLAENEAQIRQNYVFLTQNDAYRNAVKNSTGNKMNVKTRFQLAQNVLIKNQLS